MCQSLETSSEVTDDEEKLNTSFNKINSWNHVGSLCRDKASERNFTGVYKD